MKWLLLWYFEKRSSSLFPSALSRMCFSIQIYLGPLKQTRNTHPQWSISKDNPSQTRGCGSLTMWWGEGSLRHLSAPLPFLSFSYLNCFLFIHKMGFFFLSTRLIVKQPRSLSFRAAPFVSSPTTCPKGRVVSDGDLCAKCCLRGWKIKLLHARLIPLLAS